MADVVVKVCTGTNCSYRGGQAILDALESDPLLKDRVTIETTRCIDDRCCDGERSPVIEIDGEPVVSASIERVSEAIFSKLREPGDG